ncbi:hypothetical protein [Methylobacterium aquaticum]|uniref:Mu-like prophage FluMu N-terminal domain-containing protein n=1 Tax=Methylobacterium aquaticum TaxID=270351 RepID=A0A0C6FP44_9HYPH|nr:hypothetical protein [Methylobacterium aquaticum]BAQ44395.1 hypothetical protein Maq22A_c05000 [Methylobacterium aquaticum]
MVDITNRAAGPRVLYIKGGNGEPVARTLARGETADLDLHRGPDKDPVLKGYLDAGEIILGPAPAEPGQPSQEQLMAAWQERQRMAEAFALLHERVQDLEAENRRLREAAAGSNQAPGGQQGSDPTGGQGDSQGGGETTKPAAPNFDTMSDDDLKAFLVAREVTPGAWQRKRLLTEAEAVKDVKPGEAA